MAYAITSERSPEALAHMCREGCCPVKNSIFSCPFSYSWLETASKCGKVSAEMWNDLVVQKPLSSVEQLLKNIKPKDIINRMSLEGELKEIKRLLAEDSA